MRRHALLILLAVAAANARSLFGDFVYDDQPLVAQNLWIRGFSHLAQIFGRAYWSTDLSLSANWGGVYRPLPLLSYALDFTIWGLKPLGFHLTNVLIHAGASLALWRLLLKLNAPAQAALVAGAAFAVLPVHIEAVAWISGRPELLGALFCLLSWLTLAEARTWKRLTAGWLLFLAALLCKENMAAFPAVVILYDLSLGKTRWQQRLPAWVGLAAAVGLWLQWRGIILGRALSQLDTSPYFAGVPLAESWLTMAKFLTAHYLWPMISGVGLRHDFTRPALADSTLGDPFSWLSLVAVAALLSAAVRKRTTWGLPVLSFFLLLLPVSNILVRHGVIGAERFLYLPSAAFCALLGLGWARLPASSLSSAALGALLAWWTFGSNSRALAWRSDDALWRAEARHEPRGIQTELGLGVAEARAGRGAAARERFLRVLVMKPDYSEAAFALGKSYFDDNLLREARAVLTEAARRFQEKETLVLLGVVEEKRGALREARSRYEQALSRDPLYPDAHRNLGLLLIRSGKQEAGFQHLQKYAELAAGDPEAEDVRRFLAGPTAR